MQLVRARRETKGLVALQRREHDVPDVRQRRIVVCNLFVMFRVLYPRAGGGQAIDESGLRREGTHLREFAGVEHARERQQHHSKPSMKMSLQGVTSSDRLAP